MIVLLFILGLLLLFLGAELLVRGAARLALSCGMSPLVVGLTVVAVGTASPELAVAVQSAISGQADLAVGNVVGSNVFNVLFTLGISALIVPLLVNEQIVRQEVPVMIGASLLLWWLVADGRLGRADAALLLGLLVLYTAFLVAQSRRKHRMVSGESGGSGTTLAAPGGVRHLSIQFVWILVGLFLLVIGSRWLVEAAVAFARYLGMSELVIGLTIVAMGTSLPEVATSIFAALRGERDIAVGNVIGSNIFNILGVLGATGIVAPAGLAVAPSVLSFDLVVMLAVAVACLPLLFTGRRIVRWEGILFVGYYFGYTTYLILYAQQHDALEPFSAVMLGFVIPLTAVTLLLIAVRELRSGL